MDKLFVRYTVIAVAVYMVACYLCALLFGKNIWSHGYIIAFETALCFCVSAQGRYHCKYIRWTLYGITLAEIITTIDEVSNILPTTELAYVPAAVIAIGLATTTTLALRHYIRIRKIKRRYAKENKIADTKLRKANP